MTDPIAAMHNEMRRRHLTAAQAASPIEYALLDAGYKPDDFRMDVYTNGAGNSVSIMHLPTGMRETCDTSASEFQNRWTAFERLGQRLLAGC